MALPPKYEFGVIVNNIKGTRSAKSKTSKKKTSSAPVLAKVSVRIADQDKIRCRAYELFEQRGYVHGHELDDWLKAESEILAKFEPTLVGN